MFNNFEIDQALKDYIKNNPNEFTSEVNCVEAYEHDEKFREKINDLYNLHNQ